jgi:menaquinone-dependent protoporphyrinogen IX oxidase
MKKVLVTYATISGSPAEIAREIGEKGMQVEIPPHEKVGDIGTKVPDKNVRLFGGSRWPSSPPA